MSKNIAWVVGGYGQNGGNYTNNTIAQILQKEFDYEPIMVYEKEEKVTKPSIFPLEDSYQKMSLKYMFGMVRKHDLIISNPSYSDYFIGLRTPCKKIMYAQGFCTFSVLDGFFHHYVSVSDFMKKYLHQVYNLPSEVIPAFVDTNNFPTPKDFDEKLDRILVYPKFDSTQFQPIFNNISRKLKEANIPYDLLDKRIKMPQSDLLDKVNNYKFVMNLSIAEGFGLVPLEAMYLGTIPCGFDGFGGRHFMELDKNSINVPYPQINNLFNRVKLHFENKEQARKISDYAKQTPLKYTKEKFIKSWTNYLKSILA